MIHFAAAVIIEDRESFGLLAQALSFFGSIPRGDPSYKWTSGIGSSSYLLFEIANVLPTIFTTRTATTFTVIANASPTISFDTLGRRYHSTSH